MFDQSVRLAGSQLLNGRGKAIGPRIAALTREHPSAGTHELSGLLSSARRDDRPAVGLMLAQATFDEADAISSRRLLNAFLFRFGAHLQFSVGDARLSPARRLILAIAAEQAFKELPTASSSQLAAVSQMKQRLAGPAIDEHDWIATVGMTASDFGEALAVVGSELRRRLPSGTGRAKDPATLVTDDSRRPLAASTDTRLKVPLPSWLRPEFDSSPDPLVAATANWSPSDWIAEGGRDVSAAWTAFIDADYGDARDHLSALFASLGRDWGPTSTSDGLRFWHWVRLVAEMAAMAGDEVADRRRSATSALELATRCLPKDDALIDHLLVLALGGLSGSDPASSRAWAAYSVRAVAATNHEIALSSYDNSTKAEWRRTLSSHFSLMREDSRSSAGIAATLVPALRQLTQRLYVSARDSIDPSRALVATERDIKPFLDEAEASIFVSASDLIREGHRALATDALNHRELLDQEAQIEDMRAVIARSNSLLLQDFVAPLLLRFTQATLEARTRLGDTSRPDLTVRLESSRLPFSATPGTRYSIRLVLSNGGNVAAEDIRATVTISELGVTAGGRLDVLGPGGEAVIDVPAESTGVAPAAAALACRIVWSDALRQEFSVSANLAAEDQKPASWTPKDINPFSLGTISDPSRLVGRDDDLDALEALLAGGGSAYVTGHKRVGKTSLTRVLLRRTGHDRSWGGAVLSLGRALGPEQGAADLVYALMDEILSAVRDAYPGISKRLVDISPDPAGNFARAANRWIKNVARVLPAEARVVIAIDDFDELPQHLVRGPQADTLFLFLRTLVDEPWLNLIVVGSEVLPSVIEGQSHKLNQVVPFSVTNFASRAATAALLVSPTVDRLEWDEEAVDRAHVVCSGNPYYETLLGQQIWHDLRERSRSYVTSTDVDSATLAVANTAPASHFVHLWADSSGGIDHTSRRALVASAVLRAVARCGGVAQEPARTSEVMSIAQTWIQTATVPELQQHVTSLVTRQVLDRGPSEDSLLLSIPLVGIWMGHAGGRALDEQYAQSTHATAAAMLITETDLVSLSRGLVYRGEAISEIRIRAWLQQFGDNYHQHLAFQMLRRMVGDGYFPVSRLHEKVMPRLRDNVLTLASARQIVRDNNQYMKNAFLVEHGTAGDSTQGTISALCKTLKIKKANVGSAAEIPTRIRLSDNGVVVFLLDDFCGSGTHLHRALAELIDNLSSLGVDWNERVDLVVGAGVVSDLSNLPASPQPGVSVEHVAGVVLGARFRPFSPDSGIFESDKQREDAHELLTTIGNALLPNNPLGFGQDALLALLEFNCPNNAAPVFWRRGSYAGREWFPLFERST